MIRHASVVDEPQPERPHFGPLGEERFVRWGKGTDDRGQRTGHGLVEMTAARAWVTKELVPLIQRLRHVEGALRREAIEPVGVALQLREVVEERRRRAP